MSGENNVLFAWREGACEYIVYCLERHSSSVLYNILDNGYAIGRFGQLLGRLYKEITEIDWRVGEVSAMFTHKSKAPLLVG